MAKKNFSAGITQTIAHNAAVENIVGVRLSDVIQESPKKMRANPLNSDFFTEETSEYFKNLRRDVKERGIVVPLIAKQDGTLLAGHNRLRIAQELRLSLVPVQYVLEELSEEAERKFVINDNVLRRQLSGSERIRLYRILYPNFDSRLNARTNGRPKATETVSARKGEKFPFSENVQSARKGEKFPFSENAHKQPLNAAIIARDTGQTRETVKKQLQQYKKEQQHPNKQKQVESLQPHSDSINKNIIRKIEKDLLLVEGTNDATRKEIIKTLRAFVKKMA